MNSWEKVAKEMWKAILSHVSELRNQGETFQAIAEKIGVNSHSVIRSWLIGTRKADTAPFHLIMFYLERCGLDYKDFFPSEPRVKAASLSKCQARIAELELEVRELEVYRHKWEGHLEALAVERGLEAPKKAAG